MICPLKLINPDAQKGCFSCEPDCMWVLWVSDSNDPTGEMMGVCALQIIAKNNLDEGEAVIFGGIEMPED